MSRGPVDRGQNPRSAAPWTGSWTDVDLPGYSPAMAVVTQGDIERLPGGRTGCPECTVAAAIHHQERRPEGIEVVLFLLLVIAAIVLGVLGVARKKFVLPAGHGGDRPRRRPHLRRCTARQGPQPSQPLRAAKPCRPAGGDGIPVTKHADAGVDHRLLGRRGAAACGA